MFIEFLKAVDRISWSVRPYVPFTALNIAWRNIDGGNKSILDVGCGKGQTMRFINRCKRFRTVGVDIFEPYIRECRQQGIHDGYVLCDAKNLPFKEKSFDMVLCLETLEHLEKEDGQGLLCDMERIARRQVIISTPVGMHKQEAHDGNPYQKHRYIWDSSEMREYGYKVRGCGLRNIGGITGEQSRLPKFLRPLANVVWVLAGPFVYFFPKLAGDMVCVKNFHVSHRGIPLLDKLRFYKGVLMQDMEIFAVAHWEQFEFLKDTVQPVCGEIKGKTILDIGCGRLYPYTSLLHSLGNKVVGIDIAYIGVNAFPLRKYMRILRENGLANFVREFLYAILGKNKKYHDILKRLVGFPLNSVGIDVRKMDAENLDFSDETFDLVVSNATFEHIRNVPKAVSELSRVLKKGGIAYIGINLFSSLAGGHCCDYANPHKVSPWSHLRGSGHAAPVYLNKLRENEYTRLFGEKLNILHIRDIGVGEGAEFLTPEIREELKEYTEEELLKQDIIIVARREK